mmetsp:Transcript_21793/g.35009  ORF Transcript_21793/g.35009 Transcript_21793/m.35009 type:complete len:233 (+) Transcript_21793:571-1269(+)
MRFQTLQRRKHFLHCVIVRFLRFGKTTTIYTIVETRIDDVVPLGHAALNLFIARIQIQFGSFGERIEGTVQKFDNLCRLVADNLLRLLIEQNGHRQLCVGVLRVMNAIHVPHTLALFVQMVGILVIELPTNIPRFAHIFKERLDVGGTDRFIQTFQRNHHQNTMTPWTRGCIIQMITTFGGRIFHIGRIWSMHNVMECRRATYKSALNFAGRVFLLISCHLTVLTCCECEYF